MPGRIKFDIGNAFILLQASERMMQIVKIKLTLTWHGRQFDPPVPLDFFGLSAKCSQHELCTSDTLRSDMNKVTDYCESDDPSWS